LLPHSWAGTRLRIRHLVEDHPQLQDDYRSGNANPTYPPIQKTRLSPTHPVVETDRANQSSFSDVSATVASVPEQSSAGVVTKLSGKSVPETVDALRRLIEDRGFTVFNVIDHRVVAERVGVQMPDSKLVMFGKPAVGAAVMLSAPRAGLDLPLKVLVCEDGNGAVSVSYNSPTFLAERYHVEGAQRAPFEAVESIVDAVLGA
jgi:uncharacterized protein (DUF302 family)